MRPLLAAILCLAFGATFVRAQNAPAPAAQSADVFIYGASPAGVCAAIEAASDGLKVILVSPHSLVGGNIAQGGDCIADVFDQRAVGGLAREFYRRVYAYYCNTYGLDSKQVADSIHNYFRSSRFEPRVAEAVFEQMLTAQKNIEFLTDAQIVSVKLSKDKFIESVRLNAFGAEPRDVAAKVWIDASYTADLAVLAGVRFTIGREGEKTYAEDLAGFRLKDVPQKYGKGDENFQTFWCNIILTKFDLDKLPVEKPASYDASLFDAELSVILNKTKRGQSVIMPLAHKLPNGKVRFGGARLTGPNLDYAKADFAARKSIIKMYQDFALSYLWFLQNDERVPESVRKEATEYGIAKDEFADSRGVSRLPVIIENRRMLGSYVTRQSDIFNERVKSDSVAVCSSQTNGNFCSVYKGGEAPTYEGKIPLMPYPLFEISYASITPKLSECKNLLVPVCFSASHVAITAAGNEAVYMALGQAAGAAAKAAVKEAMPVQKINIIEFKRALNKAGAVTDLPPEFSAEFKWTPKTPKAGEKVVFEHIAVKTKNKPVTYYWDFDGDGTPDADLQSAKAEYTFTANKNHLVTLVIEDDTGKRSKAVCKVVNLEGALDGDFFLDTERPLSDAWDFETNVDVAAASESQVPYFGNNFKHDAASRFGKIYVLITPKNLSGRYSVYLNTSLSGFAVSKAVVEDAGGTHEVKINFGLRDNPYGLIKVGTFDAPKSLKVINDAEGKKGVTVFDTYRFIKE